MRLSSIAPLLRKKLPVPGLLLVAAVGLSACATLRPLPPMNQPIAQAELSGVVVSVPHLDTGDYPGDVLDVSTALMVVIENRGPSEVQINPQDFLLAPTGGMELRPIPPESLAYKQTPPATLAPDESMLAYRGPGFRVAPAPRPLVYHRVPAPGLHVPGWRGGYYVPRNYGYSYNRWHWWPGGPLSWGPQFYAGWYGSPWFWPWFYDGPRYYAWSRADAQRLALPAGNLPVNSRTGGFLYFPRVQGNEGLPLALKWTVRDAKTQQVLGELSVPLELRGD